MRCDAGGGRSDGEAREAIRNTDYTDCTEMTAHTEASALRRCAQK